MGKVVYPNRSSYEGQWESSGRKNLLFFAMQNSESAMAQSRTEV